MSLNFFAFIFKNRLCQVPTDPKSALTEAASGDCVFSKQDAVQIKVIGKADTILENLSGFKNIMKPGLARWSSS